MFRLVGFLLWPLLWLTAKVAWYAAIALVRLMVFCFGIVLRVFVVLFAGVSREIADGAAARKRASANQKPPSHKVKTRSPRAGTPDKPVPQVRNMSTPEAPEVPVDVETLIRHNKRRDRSRAASEWFRMWDEALTPAQQKEKQALRLARESGRSIADHSFGLFPGDYIREELDRQMKDRPHLTDT